jgi:hypothetical protein
MRQTHIANPGVNLDYLNAAILAARCADDDPEVIEPVLVAWYDRKAARMSPAIEGADLRSRWHDYGESHGGRLEVDVGDDYAFIYGDSSAFDPYEEACPYINVRDAQGNEYLCQSGLMTDTQNPTAAACVPLDEWTSKLT